MGGFFERAFHVHRSNARSEVAYVETAFAQSVLEHAYVFPQFFTEFRVVADKFETFESPHYIDKRHGFGINLGAHVVTAVCDYGLVV